MVRSGLAVSVCVAMALICGTAHGWSETVRVDELPALLHRCRPHLSTRVHRAGLGGTVVVKARIDQNGNPDSLSAYRSIRGLDHAAIEWVRCWQFEPARDASGKATPAWVMLPVKFPALNPCPPETEVDPATPGDNLHADHMPVIVHWVPPDYPDMPLNPGVEGTVSCDVLVGRDGLVKDVRIAKSVPMLDDAAVQAVRQWRFKPAMLDDCAVSIWTTVPVNFKLH